MEKVGFSAIRWTQSGTYYPNLVRSQVTTDTYASIHAKDKVILVITGTLAT